MHYIVGLGNPGEEYENTRHNTGRLTLTNFLKKNDFLAQEQNKKMKALVSEGKVGKEKVTVIFPETYMNKSGKSIASFITSVKKAHDLVVVYDDLDLALGNIKISYNRGSGGHRGLESIMKAIKTPEFIRIRVGISPQSPSGKLKKPKGDKDVERWILGDYKPKEIDALKKVGKTVAEAVEMIVKDGYEIAMGEFNTK